MCIKNMFKTVQLSAKVITDGNILVAYMNGNRTKVFYVVMCAYYTMFPQCFFSPSTCHIVCCVCLTM